MQVASERDCSAVAISDDQLRKTWRLTARLLLRQTLKYEAAEWQKSRASQAITMLKNRANSAASATIVLTLAARLLPSARQTHQAVQRTKNQAAQLPDVLLPYQIQVS